MSPDPTAHYLAVDGGNSKTDAVLGAADGRVLAFVRGPGTCHQVIGLPETLSRLGSLMDRARAGAGRSGPVERVDLFLAGVDLPEEVDLLTPAMAAQGWAPTMRLENDAYALLRAGIDGGSAAAVVCGAGINCVGRREDGRTARFLAIGDLSGDWGGGTHLARLALWHAVRGEDGRDPPTGLSAAVAGHFGLTSAEQVGVQIHLGVIGCERLPELTPVLFEVAAAGDDVAAGVVARQVEEIVALLTVVARRLDLLDAPFTAVLGGSVLRARHPLLVDPIAERLREAAPRATVTVVDAPPVLGAALAALDELGAGPAAHARLRDELARVAARF